MIGTWTPRWLMNVSQLSISIRGVDDPHQVVKNRQHVNFDARTFAPYLQALANIHSGNGGNGGNGGSGNNNNNRLTHLRFLYGDVKLSLTHALLSLFPMLRVLEIHHQRQVNIMVLNALPLLEVVMITGTMIVFDDTTVVDQS
jgi:hypothetical protein